MFSQTTASTPETEVVIFICPLSLQEGAVEKQALWERQHGADPTVVCDFT